jgi:hypothetical protein
MAAKKQQKRELTVLVRYTLKKDYPPKGLHAGDIVLYVENDKGARYHVFLRKNKAHSCTCKANAEYGRKCYHINQLVELENSRYAARKALRVVEKPAQEPVSPVGPIPLKRDMLDAPLNRQGFNLLKKVS